MYILETMDRLPVHTAHSQSTGDSVALALLEIGESGFKITN
jgi:hypothetical protein